MIQKIRVSSEERKPYLSAGYDLIPLHRYDATSTRGEQKQFDGKRPIHSNWTSKHYDSRSVVKQCGPDRANRNVGVRLTDRQLVVDVDPRNGGRSAFQAFCKDLDLDPRRWPCVLTGGGGQHYYLLLPDNVTVVDTLHQYPGVEFKSKGRQVVAAGSIHPETLKQYAWDSFEGRLELHEAPEAPPALIEAIRRPSRRESSGGGQYTQDQIARMLGSINPSHYNHKHDEWFALMCACHHSSNGDARDEFVEWSTSDPEYADHADAIGRRWDSLHAAKNDGYTFKTLIKAVRDHGDIATVPVDDAWLDFDAIDDDDGWLEAHSDDAWLDEMNAKYCGVVDGSRFRITYPVADPDEPGRICWSELTVQDFHHSLAGLKVSTVDKNGKRVQVARSRAWLDHPEHRNADGVTINPAQPPRQTYRDDYGVWLNRWNGWGVNPKRGDKAWKHTLLRRMIFDVLCNNEEQHYNYLMNWLAWKVQHPAEPTGVAVVMRGAKGVGKTTLGTVMSSLFGSHGIVLQSVDQLAGRFSGHLKTACFVFGDECFWGGNKKHESTLKKLITDRRVTFEQKFKEAAEGRNRVAIMLATNDQWAVPASLTDERRFFVLDVSDKWRVPQGCKAHPNQELWESLYRELDSGGRSAFLHHLMHRQLTGHPTRAVPQTQALAQQKLHTLDGANKWYHDCLQDGSIPDLLGSDDSWSERPLHVRPEQITELVRSALRNQNPHANVSSRALLKQMAQFGWERGRESNRERTRYWQIPALSDARLQFAEVLGFNPFDEETDADG